MSDTTGFHDVPWDVESANGGSLDGLPPTPPDFDGACCRSEWAGTYGDPGSLWRCTRPAGHDGTHQAGNGIETVAEWRDEDAEAVTR
jgi:hypothetical protein